MHIKPKLLYHRTFPGNALLPTDATKNIVILEGEYTGVASGTSTKSP